MNAWPVRKLPWLPWRCLYFDDRWNRQCDKRLGHSGPHGAT